MFLVGRGIPDHITSLPQTVLNTPFGQILKPQLDSAMRGITQAPAQPSAIPSTRPKPPPRNASSHMVNGNGENARATVHNVTTNQELDQLLNSAQSTCAIIFFTSATCPPCKMLYPTFDDLAAEAGNRAVFIKADLAKAYEIGARYQIRVTPTFMTFLRGEKENEWPGANDSKLRGNVKLLLQMAHPPHPHAGLRLPTLQRAHKRLVTYARVPPLEKLLSKIGKSDPEVTALSNFITARDRFGAADAPLPDLRSISIYIRHHLQTIPPDNLYPLIDLFRLALVDPRVSGYFAQEEIDSSAISAILSKIADLAENCPYTLRITSLQMSCNLFTTPLFPPKLLSDSTYAVALIHLVTSSLLDTEHSPIRVAAASLAFNIIATNHAQRIDGKDDLLAEFGQVELIAGLLEALAKERESKEGLRGLVTCIGLLAYMTPEGREVSQLCEVMGVKGALEEVASVDEDLKPLLKEVEMVMPG